MTQETKPEPDEQIFPDMGATLRAALTPEADVRHTARRRVDRALHARSAAAGYTSLLSCGVETLRHLLTNPADPADRYHMTEDLDLGARGNRGGHDG